MAVSPKTHKVLLKDGTEVRAVKLSARNHLTCLNWIPGAEFRSQVSKGGQESNQRLMIPINGSKVVRAVYFDDWIVKTDKGFYVVKFDKVEESIFFINSYPDVKDGQKHFKRWVKDLAA